MIITIFAIIDGPTQMCMAQRRDGSQCKSKAIAGSQFCWVGTLALLYFVWKFIFL